MSGDGKAAPDGRPDAGRSPSTSSNNSSKSNASTTKISLQSLADGGDKAAQAAIQHDDKSKVVRSAIATMSRDPHFGQIDFGTREMNIERFQATSNSLLRGFEMAPAAPQKQLPARAENDEEVEVPLTLKFDIGTMMMDDESVRSMEWDDSESDSPPLLKEGGWGCKTTVETALGPEVVDERLATALILYQSSHPGQIDWQRGEKWQFIVGCYRGEGRATTSINIMTCKNGTALMFGCINGDKMVFQKFYRSFQRSLAESGVKGQGFAGGVEPREMQELRFDKTDLVTPTDVYNSLAQTTASLNSAINQSHDGVRMKTMMKRELTATLVQIARDNSKIVAGFANANPRLAADLVHVMTNAGGDSEVIHNSIRFLNILLTAGGAGGCSKFFGWLKSGGSAGETFDIIADLLVNTVKKDQADSIAPMMCSDMVRSLELLRPYYQGSPPAKAYDSLMNMAFDTVPDRFTEVHRGVKRMIQS